jgi:hypothetical protein
MNLRRCLPVGRGSMTDRDDDSVGQTGDRPVAPRVLILGDACWMCRLTFSWRRPSGSGRRAKGADDPTPNGYGILGSAITTGSPRHPRRSRCRAGMPDPQVEVFGRVSPLPTARLSLPRNRPEYAVYQDFLADARRRLLDGTRPGLTHRCPGGWVFGTRMSGDPRLLGELPGSRRAGCDFGMT